MKKNIDVEKSPSTILVNQLGFSEGVSIDTSSHAQAHNNVFNVENGGTVHVRTLQVNGSTLYKKNVIKVPLHNLQSHNTFFLERKMLMNELTEKFIHSKDRGPVVLTGTGGTGKTSLAVKWANEHRSQYDFVHFMEMDSVSRQLSFKILVESCGIPYCPEKTEAELLAAILACIKFKNWLIIWDNVNSVSDVHALLPHIVFADIPQPSGFIRFLNLMVAFFFSISSIFFRNNYEYHEYFKEAFFFQPKHHFLITSRDDPGFCLREPIRVGSFEPEEAWTYLEMQMKSRGSYYTLENVKELAHTLAYHPLALELAIGQITSSYLDEDPLGNLIEYLKEHSVKDLNPERTKDDRLAFINKHNLASLWKWGESTLLEEARTLLRWTSFLHSDIIRSELLLNFLEATYPRSDSRIYSQAVGALYRQSLVQKKAVWYMHRLLQRVIREDTLALEENYDWKTFLINSWLAYKKTFCQKSQEGDIQRCQEAVLHANTWLSFFPKFFQYFSDKEFITHWKAKLFTALGKNQRILAYYDQAQEALTQALMLEASFKIPSLPESAEIQLQLGILFYKRGEYTLATKHLLKVLELFENTPLTDEVIALIAETKGELGSAYLDSGVHPMAYINFYAALKGYNMAYGKNTPHFHTASTLHELGRLDQAKGKLTLAYKRYKQSLIMKYIVYGKTVAHPEIASTLHQLGFICRERGNDRINAHNYLTRALDMKYAVYGRDTMHSSIASTLHELGRMYRECGERIWARQYYKDSLSMKYAIYGEKSNHMHIAATLHQLGELHQDEEELGEAENNYKKALTMCREIYSDPQKPYPGMISILYQLSRVCRKRGNATDAMIYAQEAFAMLPHFSGPTFEKQRVNLQQIISQLNNTPVVVSEEDKVEDRDQSVNRMAIHFNNTILPVSSFHINSQSTSSNGRNSDAVPQDGLFSYFFRKNKSVNIFQENVDQYEEFCAFS